MTLEEFDEKFPADDGNGGGYLNCWRCNADEHYCPGCGEPGRHGFDVCLKCRNTL